ncbi:hypothetical protein ACIOEX_25285, partial [Streptomyces sp. NPDC087850]|uniref:hypothetical protein n=1 Tax=Streptomyces sp. NPDC087850 TaxID=3365809 RepID=UPI003807FB59
GVALVQIGGREEDTDIHAEHGTGPGRPLSQHFPGTAPEAEFPQVKGDLAASSTDVTEPGGKTFRPSDELRAARRSPPA